MGLQKKVDRLDRIDPRVIEFLSNHTIRVCDVCEHESASVRTHWTTTELIFLCHECYVEALERFLSLPKKAKVTVDEPLELNPLREI